MGIEKSSIAFYFHAISSWKFEKLNYSLNKYHFRLNFIYRPTYRGKERKLFTQL